MMKNHIEEWLITVQRRFTKNTHKMYRCVIYQLYKYISLNGNQLSANTVENFLDSKLQQGYSRKQWNSYLICIRSFAAWREAKYKIKSNINKIPFIAEDPPKQRVLTKEEYARCLKHTTGMDNQILQFIANLGIRKAEFAALRWDDIPADLQFIRIKGKGRKFRIAPTNDIIRSILRKYERLANNEPLQITQRYPGGEGISWMCRRVAKEINIPRFGAHSLRHFFATEMIKHNVNLHKLAKILGHSSVQTTESIYLHLAPVDLLGSTDCLADDKFS